LQLFSEAKASVPGHQISWVIAELAHGGRLRIQRSEIWHKGSLADEDDARTSNTRIEQRKRAIPHSTKTRRNMSLRTSVTTGPVTC